MLNRIDRFRSDVSLYTGMYMGFLYTYNGERDMAGSERMPLPCLTIRSRSKLLPETILQL